MTTFTKAMQVTPSFFALDENSSGASKEAHKVPAKYRAVVTNFIGSATGNERIAEPRQTIYDIQYRCQASDWNGEEATPISKDAAVLADRLLPTLPSYLPVPDIYADPTGAIAFEWYRRPRHRLAISIYGDGTIEYAGLLGSGNDVYGSARHVEGLPRIIGDHLRQLFTD